MSTASDTPPVVPDNEPVAPKVEPPKRQRRRRAPSGPTPAQIGKQLSASAKAVTVGALMATGQGGALAHPELVTMVETRCDSFGAAWAAVAEQDKRVAAWIQSLMQGGVWVAACGQTALLAGMIGVMTGKLRLPLGAVAFVMPELGPYLLRAAAERQSENGAPPEQPEPDLGGMPDGLG